MMLKDEEKIKQLNKKINSSSRIVFFTGAGISTASGIPDFRSKDGLYNQKYKYPPEEILSKGFFFVISISGSTSGESNCVRPT